MILKAGSNIVEFQQMIQNGSQAATKSVGKSARSDWFFRRQDFAKWNVSMEMIINRVFSLQSRQVQGHVIN